MIIILLIYYGFKFVKDMFKKSFDYGFCGGFEEGYKAGIEGVSIHRIVQVDGIIKILPENKRKDPPNKCSVCGNPLEFVYQDKYYEFPDLFCQEHERWKHVSGNWEDENYEDPYWEREILGDKK